MSVPVLGDFPSTIANLPDRPNLSADKMKEALQQDLAYLWPFVQQLINEVNRSPVKVGNDLPSAVASQLSVGDVYIYVPDLPAS